MSSVSGGVGTVLDWRSVFWCRWDGKGGKVVKSCGGEPGKAGWARAASPLAEQVVPAVKAGLRPPAATVAGGIRAKRSRGDPDPPWRQMLASSVGVTLASLVVLPLDVVKTRNQATGRSSRESISGIMRVEGARGFWRGLAPTLVMAIPGSSMYFIMYNRLREAGNARLPEQHGWISAPGSAFIARTATATAVAPLEMIRTNLMAADPNASVGGWRQAVQRTYQNRGARGFFAGLTATIARDSPYSAIYWGTFETLRLNWIMREVSTPKSEFQTTAETAVAGVISGMTSACFTTPFDTIKTVLQADPTKCSACETLVHQRGFVPVARCLVEQRGVRGLFAGLVPRMLRVTPSSATMMTVLHIIAPNTA